MRSLCQQQRQGSIYLLCSLQDFFVSTISSKAKAKNDPKKKASPKQQGKGKAKPRAKASASAASSSAQAHTAEIMWAHAVMDDNDMSFTDAALPSASLACSPTTWSFSACTFYTTFTPASNSTEPTDENGIFPQSWIQEPLTAFFHCCGSPTSNRSHPRRFTSMWQVERALLYQNVICCATISCPLISVGQLKTMLELRMVWGDSSPSIHACSGGLRYILIEASIYHNLPVITLQETQVLLQAIGDFTRHGTLYNAATWSRSWEGS